MILVVVWICNYFAIFFSLFEDYFDLICMINDIFEFMIGRLDYDY